MGGEAMTADSVPLLLVMGSGDQRYREYLLASAASRCGLWLFDPDPASWQRPHIMGETVLDVFDPPAAMAAAAELASEHPIAGVYCYHEAVILAAAHVAALLGVPGPSVAAVTAVRDKLRTRQLLTGAGLPQPRHALVSGIDDARAAAAAIGFPLVSKPCGLGASQGVVKAETMAELDEAVTVSQSAHQRGMITKPEILLEEYLPGPEISVDAAVTGDDYLPFLIARKQVGEEPFFEETGHVVAAGDPLLSAEPLMGMLADAHRAVGWRNGITHTEVKLTSRGPFIIEINGRLGGDLIPYLGQLATGIDAGQVALDLALGTHPKLDRVRDGSAGIRFLYPPQDCRVREVRLPGPAEVPGLYEATVLVRPGDEMRLPPDGYVTRYAYLIARASDPGSCARSLDAAAELAAFSYDPLTRQRTR
jgi:biotin carboxylase